MVTAIVIPALILYFYLVTKKEKTKQRERWEKLSEIPLEASVEGEILDCFTEKKRFYHEYYSLDTTMRIKEGNSLIKALIRQQLKPDTTPYSFSKGQTVQLLGKWEGTTFHIGKIIQKRQT
ncbi:hypothetical protein FIU87_08810 [Bacillus sp. THAF10]|uniref:hypothetical protein n=1 Tax=Bacillus sp. THAF10 TaxID=2587848 RepID=UPI001268D07B|nr:hypothetical protein [Bacillus sp. THAF10]QFT88743.1 hypothetical protein FIU87_08810 [Bacillus sp. THAF10]